MMKNAQQLRGLLESIDRKSYPAYKSAQGAYDFTDYVLSIDHVQGDPFASPSKLSITVTHQKAGYPAECFDTDYKQVALEDYLVRQFAQEIGKFNFKAKGSGKSGLISTSRPGPEILRRTACEIGSKGITLRFEAGFPANGRTINSGELVKILFDFLPRCVRNVCFYKNRDAREVAGVAYLAEDQHFIREELDKRGLVSFVANGAILPRESGVSSRPMAKSVPFQSPEALRVTMELPHHGTITGMGIRKGITLIVGGGYHGKSTLLKALETGVYNHVAGDGREYVITEDSAMKLRAEDGRSVRNTDISLFINDLPNRKDTHCFSTEDASGSTSQAAAVIEGIEAGCRTFLIDEDTSATNFMVRDDLMQKIISRDKEPITPFIERARDLYEKAGISTIMVAGSSGAYFYIADTVIQMDSYLPYDITEEVKSYCAGYGAEPITSAPGFFLPTVERKLGGGRKGGAAPASMAGQEVLTQAAYDEENGSGDSNARGGYGSERGGYGGERGSYGNEHGGGYGSERGGHYGRGGGNRGRGGYGGGYGGGREDGRGDNRSDDRGAGRDSRGRDERIKVKVFGKDSLQVGRETVDLRFVEQLIDSEQTTALAQMLRYCLEKRILEQCSVKEAVRLLTAKVSKEGLASINDSSYAAVGLCQPRTQEIFACLNRYRG